MSLTSSQSRPAVAQVRARGGEFGSVYTALELLSEVIPEVARSVDDWEPEEVSMPAWNSGRTAAGYPEAPSAEAIHQRFNSLCANGSQERSLSWRKILVAACDPEHNHARRLVVWGRSAAGELDDRRIYFALQRVGLALGARTFAAGSYDDQADILIARERRAGEHYLAELLPTSNQIIFKMGSWNAALVFAGFDPYRRRAPQRGPLGGSTPCRRQRPRGLPLPVAICLFVEYNGRFPGTDELTRWTKESGGSLTGARSRPYREFLAEAAAKLREQGRAVPPLPSGRPGRPEGPLVRLDEREPYTLAPVVVMQEALAAAHPAPTLDSPDPAGREFVLAALGEYLDCLRPGQDGRAKQYQALAVGKPWPNMTQLNRHGRFQELLAEARRRRNAAQ